MASKTDICNLALIRLGEKTILNLDETNKATLLLNIVWDLVLRLVLREHPWNFALARASLAQVAAAPEFGYDYAYQLPADQVRILGLVGDEFTLDPTLDYVIEGEHLLTDATTAKIRYVKVVDTTGIYNAHFVSALAARLAAEICGGLINRGEAFRRKLMDEYHQELATAKALDSQESPPEVFEINYWINARA